MYNWTYKDFANWLQQHQKLDYITLVEYIVENGFLLDEVEEFENWLMQRKKATKEDIFFEKQRDKGLENEIKNK